MIVEKMINFIKSLKKSNDSFKLFDEIFNDLFSVYLCLKVIFY